MHAALKALLMRTPGKMHFVKFETANIDHCVDFIEAKGLHRTHNGNGEPEGKVRIIATGGGAFKYADSFQVSSHMSNLIHKADHEFTGTCS